MSDKQPDPAHIKRDAVIPRCPKCSWALRFQGMNGLWQGICPNPDCQQIVVADRGRSHG